MATPAHKHTRQRAYSTPTVDVCKCGYERPCGTRRWIDARPVAPAGKPFGGVALITIGRGGSTVYKYQDRPTRKGGGGWWAGSISRIEGYDPDFDFYIAKHPDLEVPEGGIPIIDTRPAVDKHGASVVFRGPLVDVMADAPIPAPATGAGTIGEALVSTGGAFGAMVAAHRAGRMNLDAVPVAEYVAYWRAAGAATGRIHRNATGLVIVWDTVTT